MAGSQVVIEVQGRQYRVTLERAIARSQRMVTAVAYDQDQRPAGRYEMSTAASKAHLRRDTVDSPPTWKELEDLAVSMLKLDLEE